MGAGAESLIAAGIQTSPALAGTVTESVPFSAETGTGKEELLGHLARAMEI